MGKGLYIVAISLKKILWMANKHTETSLVSQQNQSLMREIHIRITMRSHFPSVKRPATTETDSNKRWRGRGETGALTHRECKTAWLLWKVLKPLNGGLPRNRAVPLLGSSVYPRALKTCVHANTRPQAFAAALSPRANGGGSPTVQQRVNGETTRSATEKQLALNGKKYWDTDDHWKHHAK